MLFIYIMKFGEEMVVIKMLFMNKVVYMNNLNKDMELPMMEIKMEIKVVKMMTIQ